MGSLRISVLLLAGMGACFGQESRGTIFGRVQDASGAVIAGAAVHALNLETNTGGSSATNHEGNYEIPLLQPGTYRVTVDLAGFKKSVSNAVHLSVDDRLPLDFKLELGDVSQTILVTAEATELEATSPSIGVLVDDKTVTELPVAGGSPFYLTRLSPGVASSGGHAPGNPFDQNATSSMVVSGTRSGSSEISMDGVSNMSGTSSTASPPGDMVQEFKVQTLPFDASLGHGTGAIVNVSIKSGTNQVHGTGYLFDSRIRATPWFLNNWLYNPATGPVTEEKRKGAGNEGWLHQRWGDTIGGPIYIPKVYNGRNRSFFIFGYEGMYVRRQPTTTLTVPTLKQREGDFSGLLPVGARYQIYDPATIRDAGNGVFTRLPLAGNIVPASRVSPIGRKLASYYPEPNAQGTVDGRQNYFRVYDENKDYRSFLTRLDHTFSESHRAFLRLNQGFYGTHVQTMPTIALGNITTRSSWGLVLDDVIVLTPRSLVNLRFGFTYQNPTTSRYSQGFDLLSLGFPQSLLDEIRTKNNPEGIAFPQITSTGYTALSTDGGNTSTTNYQTFAGTFTKLAGNHSVRTGGEFRLLRENGYNFGNVAPNLDFGTTWTKGPNQNSAAAPIGQGLASMLLGYPTGGGIDINASRAEQSTFTAAYIQDDWRIARRLTLNIGLRYEFEGATTERYNRSVRGFDFNAVSPVDEQARANYAKAPQAALPVEQFRLRGGLTFPGADGNPAALWTPDRNNFAPRIGLAYMVARKTVIRTGYGIFYGLKGIDRQDVNQGGFNQTTPFVASQDNGLHFRATLADPFPDGLQAQTGSSMGLRTNIGKGATFFPERSVNPYMQRWTFSMQREFPHRILVDASYVGNRGTKLNANRQFSPVPREYLSTAATRDQPKIDVLGAQVTNPFYGIPEFFGTTLGNQRVARSALFKPYPQFTGVTSNIPVGYSYYHAFQTMAQKRFSRGTSFQVSYTWSKFMEAAGFLNPTDPRPEKVISDQDRAHRVVFSGIFELPIGRGKLLLRNSRGLLQTLIGGWQVQGWYEGQSGEPLGFGNAIFTGSLQDVPLPVAQRSISRWFNAGAGFETNSGRQLSNNIRTLSTRFNNVRGDGINNADMSVFKVFRITEKLKAQFRAEAINALNHVEFDNPNTTPDNTAFGTVTKELGHGQRQMTFAVKLMF